MTQDAADRLAATRVTGSTSTRGAWVLSRVGDRAYPGLIWTLGIAAGAFVLLVARRPTTVFRAEFWGDDGPIYSAALARGFGTITESYGGALIVIQRVLVWLESLVPPYWAPVVGNVLALAVAVAVAVFIASDRLAAFAPSRNLRLALAATVLLVPASGQVLGTLSHIQWVLGAWLVAMLVATPGRHRVLERAALLAVSLTGVLSIVVAPLFVARAVVDRPARWMAVPVVLGAFIQAATMLTVYAGSPGASGTDWSLAPEILATRLTGLPLAAALPVLGLWLIAVARLPRRLWLPLAYIVLAIPLLGIYRTPETAAFLTVDQFPPRYFWLGTAIMAAAVLIAPPNLARTALLGVFVVVAALGFALPSAPAADWAHTSACIGGPTPCVVPVAPRVEGDPWAVRWLR